MNVLFLTLLDFKSYSEHNIYCDLLREFIKNGHEVYCVSPIERRFNTSTHFEENKHLLKLKIGNTQKTNIIEKGISTLLIKPQFKKAIKRFFPNVHFDLVLYSTPPITLIGAVEYVKKRDSAHTYLLLKDIFPQNAVDIGLMETTGLKSILYKYFRHKEKKLYAASDHIGCMSQANVDYLLSHNPEISEEIVQICPNSIEPAVVRLNDEKRVELRVKFCIPLEKTVFIYGGNLGKPQNIPFVIQCMKAASCNENSFFVICGSGTEYGILKEYVDSVKPDNLLLIQGLPRNEYEEFVGCCDVGLIFLDYRFTIPNYPSRILSYMQKCIPILACTDQTSDIGTTIVDGDFGWWCPSNDAIGFANLTNSITGKDVRIKGIKSGEYIKEHFSVNKSYDMISFSNRTKKLNRLSDVCP